MQFSTKTRSRSSFDKKSAFDDSDFKVCAMAFDVWVTSTPVLVLFAELVAENWSCGALKKNENWGEVQIGNF